MDCPETVMSDVEFDTTNSDDFSNSQVSSVSAISDLWCIQPRKPNTRSNLGNPNNSFDEFTSQEPESHVLPIFSVDSF